MPEIEQNVEHQYEEYQSLLGENNDEYDEYDEYDDYAGEPIFEKTNRHKGIQKVRW